MIAKTLLLAAQLQAPLTVMSYNIRYDNPRDGPDAWPQRRGAMAVWLGQQAPDLLGLQEALRGQLDDLRGVPGYGEIGVGREDGATRGEYAAILYRTGRLEPLEQGTFWFSDTPHVPGSRSWGNQVTRICTWARFRDRQGGRTFYVYNVHLDHESQTSRERSVAALLRAIGERRHPDDPVIVTGDFNAGPSNPAVRAMRAGFTDTYASRDSLEGTFNGFRGDTAGPKIDFIFTDTGFRPAAARIERPRTPEGRELSDHFAVVAVLEYQRRTARRQRRSSPRARRMMAAAERRNSAAMAAPTTMSGQGRPVSRTRAAAAMTATLASASLRENSHTVRALMSPWR